MRKIICGLLCICVLCGSCACGKTENSKIQADESTFLLNVTVDCEADVYTIHYEYYLGNTAIGGGTIRNADHSPIKQGDTLTKEFIPDDFPKGADFENFRLELYVVDEHNDEYLCNKVIEFKAEYGKTYPILITGSYKNGFSAQVKI